MRKHFLVWSLLLLAGVLATGCAPQTASHGEDAAETPEPTVEAAPEVAPAVEITPEIEAKLAAADLVDGEEDKVVSRCPGCGFGMEGSEENALQVGDYSLHFCTSACKTRFEEDVAGNILALEIPEGEATVAQQ